jgi:spore germination cell wall hydrolase CwlJ-like protein
MILATAAAICLAKNIYFEARDQDLDGQRLVAEVTISRLEADGFPKTVCGVVWQKGQFSWTEDGKSDTPKDEKAWLLAQEIAADVLMNGCDLCTGATHFATVGTDPYWAADMDEVWRWGDHVFYAKWDGCDE